jgi:hypothetical protein
MHGMDLKKIQPTIDILTAEIQLLTSARATLLSLGMASTSQLKQKTPAATSKARSEAQRKRWAEAKRKSREAKKGTK